MKRTRLTDTGRAVQTDFGLLGFLWGGWALYVNGDSGPGTRLISGMVQGSASFVITLVMVRTVSWLFHNLPVNPLRFILPSLVTVSTTGSCLALVHYIAGTPKILHTICPALAVAFSFCLFTTFKLQHAMTRRANRDGKHWRQKTAQGPERNPFSVCSTPTQSNEHHTQPDFSRRNFFAALAAFFLVMLPTASGSGKWLLPILAARYPMPSSVQPVRRNGCR